MDKITRNCPMLEEAYITVPRGSLLIETKEYSDAMNNWMELSFYSSREFDEEDEYKILMERNIKLIDEDFIGYNLINITTDEEGYKSLVFMKKVNVLQDGKRLLKGE